MSNRLRLTSAPTCARPLAPAAVGLLATLLLTVAATLGAADAQVTVDRNQGPDATPAFRFAHVPTPAGDDLAAKAVFELIDGRQDGNGGSPDKLHDGWLPGEEDEPAESFFCAAGTEGGRLWIDLGAMVEVRQVNTYSWHPGTRGPQVYTLYGSAGTGDGFVVKPAHGTDPGADGWQRLAAVDTRPHGHEAGGQYGVRVAAADGGALGRFRYLLVDMVQTEADDPFGNTFYSEIDVVGAEAPEVAATEVPRPGRLTLQTEDGSRIALDTAETPDLKDWVAGELAPVVRDWYPRIARLLASDGYQAPRRLSIVFDPKMDGVAATGGTGVRCAAGWFRGNLAGEAKGAVVHELVHVVQQYGRRPLAPGAEPGPGWLVEGIADYVRWFLYEPQSRGAEVSRAGLARARYDGSYRVSANFLNWACGRHGQKVVTELNAALREGRYRDDQWRALTGHTAQELGEQWKADLAKALGG